MKNTMWKLLKISSYSKICNLCWNIIPWQWLFNEDLRSSGKGVGLAVLRKRSGSGSLQEEDRVWLASGRGVGLAVFRKRTGSGWLQEEDRVWLASGRGPGLVGFRKRSGSRRVQEEECGQLELVSLCANSPAISHMC